MSENLILAPKTIIDVRYSKVRETEYRIPMVWEIRSLS
jgi:hypothetical protein